MGKLNGYVAAQFQQFFSTSPWSLGLLGFHQINRSTDTTRLGVTELKAQFPPSNLTPKIVEDLLTYSGLSLDETSGKYLKTVAILDHLKFRAGGTVSSPTQLFAHFHPKIRKDKEFYRKLFRLHAKQGDFYHAMQDFSFAMRDPKLFAYFLHVAATAGHFEFAWAEYSKRRYRDPWVILAVLRLCEQTGHAEEAKQVARSVPNILDAGWEFLFNTFDAVGDFEGIKEFYPKVPSDAGNLFKIQRSCIFTFVARGAIDEAWTFVKKWDLQDSQPIIEALMLAYIDHGFIDEALKLFSRIDSATEIQGRSSFQRRAMAGILRMPELSEEAIKYAEFLIESVDVKMRGSWLIRRNLSERLGKEVDSSNAEQDVETYLFDSKNSESSTWHNNVPDLGARAICFGPDNLPYAFDTAVSDDIGDYHIKFLENMQTYGYDMKPSNVSEKAQSILPYHVEKQALTFLLQENASELHIKVNRRICFNCHSFFEAASGHLQREIRVQDTNTVHRFVNGKSKCGVLPSYFWKHFI